MAYRPDPRGVRNLLQIAEKEELDPDEKILQQVEKFFQFYRKLVKQEEQGQRVPFLVRMEAKMNWRNWIEFTDYYKGWLGRVRPDMATDPVNQYEPKVGQELDFEEWNRKEGKEHSSLKGRQRLRDSVGKFNQGGRKFKGPKEVPVLIG